MSRLFVRLVVAALVLSVVGHAVATPQNASAGGWCYVDADNFSITDRRGDLVSAIGVAQFWDNRNGGCGALSITSGQQYADFDRQYSFVVLNMNGCMWYRVTLSSYTSLGGFGGGKSTGWLHSCGQKGKYVSLYGLGGQVQFLGKVTVDIAYSGNVNSTMRYANSVELLNGFG